jgi:glycosyltransferase involved in cell wall biosynthesis
MLQNIPLVSILMPTYNRALLIGKSIESVIAQNYSNWELLVIDDGSTDGTQKIINEYSANDKRIKLLSIPRTKFNGISKYLNYGIEKSNGKYIARIDDDDFWCNKNKLSQQVDFLEKNPDYVLVGGGVQLVDNDGKVMYEFFENHTDEEIRKNALKSNPFSHSSVLFRKDIAQLVGCYGCFRNAEDWEFWLRLGKKGKLYNFNEYYTAYLYAGQNLSTNSQKDIVKNVYEIIKKYKKDYPNYCMGVMIITMQYLFSLFPVFIKKRLQTFLIYVKRKYL